MTSNLESEEHMVEVPYTLLMDLIHSTRSMAQALADLHAELLPYEKGTIRNMEEWLLSQENVPLP